MRIVDIRERGIAISRYADPAIPSGGLTTSLVAVVTDVMRAGKPVVGYGFSSVGRFAQGGLVRERFAPRLLRAGDDELSDAADTNLDPFKAWHVMMTGEKSGGHGERCVAVGTLDMAIWDAAASRGRCDEHLRPRLRSRRGCHTGAAWAVVAGRRV
jgi:L-alanine-DL-glutamate epimerase-like enolase superfamily enzyme